ncbi:MAG: twin-arginine translocase TatA/TatE family subunit [Planctomycetota bacterium]
MFHDIPTVLPAQIGWKEIVIVLVALLVLFGGRKLPELARGLGRGLREFKNELKGVKDEVNNGLDTDAEGGAATGEKPTQGAEQGAAGQESDRSA